MNVKSLLYSLVLGSVAMGFSHAAYAKVHHASPDTLFVKKAAAGGLTEVELGKIAQQNGESQDVKDFGAKMVTDHSKINDNLKAIAAKDSLTIPDKPTDDQQALIDKLGKETGKSFDNAYIRAMLKAHIGDKALFTEEASDTKNADLKQFATDSLQVIKEHLSMIQEIAGTHGLAGGHKSSSTAMSMGSSSTADPGMSKSGAAPGSNANPEPIGSAPTGDSSAPATMNAPVPSTGDAGQSKSGLAPDANANPAPAPQ
jgi:putative membrane protein